VYELRAFADRDRGQPPDPEAGSARDRLRTDAPNPITKRPITSVEVVYSWAGSSNDVNLTGNATSYTFTATQAGFVEVNVAAWDAGGNSSGFTNLQVAVNPQEANGGLGGGGPGSPVDLLIIGAVLVVIGVILLYVAIKAVGLWWLKVILVLVGAILVVVGAWILIASIATLLGLG